MIATQTGLFLTTSFSLFLLSLIHFFQTCDANNCSPSACGTIRNISYPFHLKDDPNHCGDRIFELACENNVTFLYLNSLKFYVKAINYNKSTIRLVDASINNDDVCSFPTFSYAYNFSLYNPHRLNFLSYDDELSLPINLISCPHPLNNTSLFTDITHNCASNSNSFHPTKYAYIKVGHMYVTELPETCELDLIVMTSWLEIKHLNNVVSLSEIHQSLLYGFERSFPVWSRTNTKWVEYRNFFISGLISPVLIIPVILVMLCAAVCPPVMAIIGFTAVVGLLTFIAYQLYCHIKFPGMGFDTLDSGIGLNPISSGFFSSNMMVCAPRLIIYPLVVWLLIYKFRRRHLSSYNAIESFLQSDTKLAPIRYSYSNIKKMTRGFRDKLGEGGYGSVYKGKLRSGHHVAVKMLGKSGENGQDFLNEIATIGRIHHVNVVTLVGYCAQGSKRALVFDFMPNGSLEKYLFNRENMNVLNWDMKFEIAVGVVRGIEYLHRGCDIQILHFDIKPHNILLDDKFVPKISDFGLAKFCSTEKNTMTLTAARGTIGYVAPELINRGIGRVSYKADVYSFGMLLMEMVGLNRNMVEKDDDSSKYFPCWIYDRFNQGMDIIAIANVDENDNSDARKLARKMTIVALWCIQMNPDDRPSMNKVLEMLEGDVERLRIPEYPSQSAHMAVNEEESSWGTDATDSVSLLHYNNDTSIEITIA